MPITTLVFTNDFAAFLPETPSADAGQHPLLRAHALRPAPAGSFVFHPGTI